MRLRSISLRDFRNHAATEIVWSAGQNILVGKNGQGKTNVLEAISYLCLGRSFTSAGDAVVLRRDARRFTVRGELEADRGVVFTVDVEYDGGTGTRKVRVGGSPLERRSDLIGMFPVVVLSPEHTPITNGGPAERRRMVDTTLAQSERAYLEDVVEYRKALRQRNRVLYDARQTKRIDRGALEPWDDVLVRRGARLTDRRRRFCNEFQPFVQRAVSHLSGAAETPAIVFQSSVGEGTPGEATEDVFRKRLQQVRNDEMRAGTTLIGPHRDEFELQLNGVPVRLYASQGQHKTMLVGLKFAEFSFLKEACGETPMLLLDDVLSELDPDRNTQVFGLTENAAQAFITAADPRLLTSAPSEDAVVVRVENGRVRKETHANA